MDKIFEAVDNLIKSADKLGALSTAAILAFFCLVFLCYIFYLLRQQRLGQELAWQGRFKDADADKTMASAVELGFQKVASELHEVRFEVRELQEKCGVKVKTTEGDNNVQVAKDK